jgi:hypothetical protein
MRQRQGGLRLVGHPTLLRLLLVVFLAPIIVAAQLLGAEAERKPQGKPAAKPDYVLTIKDNLVSLAATNASLKKILEEIGQRTSIEVFALLPEQEKITTEFEQLPLEETIERLIRNYSHLVVSKESDKKITQITVLRKSQDTISSKPVGAGPEIKRGR